MGTVWLTDLVDVVHGAGLAVVAYPGWDTRARGSGGYEPGRPTHVMVHHTASPPSSDGQPDADYIAVGSPDAPLSNLYLDRSGTVWVIAAGATNTNGKGCDSWGGGVPDDSMNSYAIGIEAGNDGVGEVWPAVQCRAYLALVDALCHAYGVPVGHVRGHAEWAPDRKIDPAGPSPWATGPVTWDLDAFRGDLLPAPPEPGEDMALTDDDVERVAAAVWARLFTAADAGPQPAGWILGQTYGLTQRAVRASETAASILENG